MKKSYLFIYNELVGSAEKIRDVLDKMPSIEDWRYDMPHVFYLVSESSASDLAKEFELRNGTRGMFIFLEYTGNSQGRLTEDSWYLLNNKMLKRQ